MSDDFNPTIHHVEGQKWEIRRWGKLCARLTLVAVDGDLGISLDVQPAPEADYAQAIAFGATPTHERNDRIAFDPRKRDGSIRDGEIPWLCVETSRGLRKLHE